METTPHEGTKADSDGHQTGSAPAEQHVDGSFCSDDKSQHCTLPVPALPLSNALLFANPTFDCLSDLGKASDRWQDAVVLATPFSLPRTGKLNRPVNLSQSISPLVAASIRFDPDRELTIASEGFTPGAALDDVTTDALAAVRKIRVLAWFPAAPLPALLRLMPSLSAVHIATAEQFIAGNPALLSLEGLRELHVTNCSDLEDLSLMVEYRAVHTLSLGGCFNLKDVSALASLTSLRVLGLRGCAREVDLSAVDSLSLIVRDIQRIDRDPWKFEQYTMPHMVPVELLGTYVDFLRSDDPDDNMQGTLMIRKMLSVDVNSPVEDVFEHGCVPLFVDQLLRDEFPKLQFESAWALTNMLTDGKSFEAVLNTEDVISNLVRLLESPYEDCREQACWAIGNLVGEGAVPRNMCLDAGALQPLLAVVTAGGQKGSTVRNAAWALSNTCRHKPLPDHQQVAPAFPILGDMLHHKDDEIVIDGAWAFSFLTDGPEDLIQSVLDTGCLPRLVELLGSRSSAMITPVIHVARNIFAGGNDHQKAAVLSHGAVHQFHGLFAHPKRSIKKDICCAVSKLTAGTQDHIQAVIDATLFTSLIDATKAPEFDVTKEAISALVGASSGGSPAQISHLVRVGVLPCLCDLLGDPNKKNDAKIIFMALRTIMNILKAGERKEPEGNPYADEVVNCCGNTRIEELQSHSDPDIQELAKYVVKTHFAR